MKYYAVTEDPNELMHFGILGMKWGRRRTPEQLGHPRHTGSRRRSAAYKKASAKLSKAMQKGVVKVQKSWKEYNSPAAKESRFMQKALEQARNGTLKYGKLTDDQVRRVTDRLALERNARQFGSTENPKYGKRLRSAIGDGIIRGIGGGTGAYIEERFRGRGRMTAEIKAEKRRARYENSIAGKRAQRKLAKSAQRSEFLKKAYEEDMNPLDRTFMTANERAKYLAAAKEKDRLSEVRRVNEATWAKSYYSNMGKNFAEWQKDRLNAHRNDLDNDWNNSRSIPRLPSGSGRYPVTRNTYSTPNTVSSDEILIVDEHGKVVRKRRGR